jgi:cytochrome c-type biogenesis protein CcmH/NrfF
VTGAAGGSRGRGAAVALGAAVLVAAVALVVVAVRGPSRPPTVSERVRSVAEELRCPECQNLSVADSPSGIAQEMRQEIARRLRLGQTAGQIDDFFVARYGRWILLTPDAGGIGLLAWLAPALAVAVGGGLAWTVLRRRRRGGDPTGAAEVRVGTEPASELGGDPADVAGGAAGELTEGPLVETAGPPRLTDEERDRVQREIAQLEEVP